MDGKTIGWIILGVGVLALGAFGVKVYVDRKNDEEMLRGLEEEYQQRKALQNGADEKTLYALIGSAAEEAKTKEEANEETTEEEIDLGEELDLRIDDEEEDDSSAKIDEKAEKARKKGKQTLRKAQEMLG